MAMKKNTMPIFDVLNDTTTSSKNTAQNGCFPFDFLMNVGAVHAPIHVLRSASARTFSLLSLVLTITILSCALLFQVSKVKATYSKDKKHSVLFSLVHLFVAEVFVFYIAPLGLIAGGQDAEFLNICLTVNVVGRISVALDFIFMIHLCIVFDHGTFCRCDTVEGSGSGGRDEEKRRPLVCKIVFPTVGFLVFVSVFTVLVVTAPGLAAVRDLSVLHAVFLAAALWLATVATCRTCAAACRKRRVHADPVTRLLDRQACLLALVFVPFTAVASMAEVATSLYVPTEALDEAAQRFLCIVTGVAQIFPWLGIVVLLCAFLVVFSRGAIWTRAALGRVFMDEDFWESQLRNSMTRFEGNVPLQFFRSS